MKTSHLNAVPIFVLAILSLFVIYSCKKSSTTSELNTSVTTTTKSTKTDTVATTPAKTIYATIPLTDEQITLVPYFYKSQTSDSSYLSFVAKSKNSYCSTSSIKFADSVVNNSFDLNFLGVVVPVPCNIGVTPIGTVINFTQNQPNSLPNGTFPFNVTLNGTPYSGSIIASSTNITFNWNYTSGVLISPKQISR